MTTVTTQQLAHVDDDELERLAALWRSRAGYGDREAFGIAHALEVEMRRRTRASQMQQLPQEAPALRRPWWKFWQATHNSDSMPSSSRPST